MPGAIIPTVAAGYRAYKRARTAYRYASPYIRAASKGGVGGGRRKVRGSRTKFARAVRKVILSTAEKCYKSVQKDGQAFNHDTLHTVNAWTPTQTTIFPSQGNGDAMRRGDEIYATGIMIRAVFQIPHDRRNTKFKLWFVQYDEAKQGILNKTNFFHNISNNVMVDPVQTDRWQGCVKYLGMLKCSTADQTTGSQDKTIIYKKWIPMKKKLTFLDDTVATPCAGLSTHGALVVCPYDTISSSTIDTIITTSEVTFTLYYRDP